MSVSRFKTKGDTPKPVYLHSCAFLKEVNSMLYFGGIDASKKAVGSTRLMDMKRFVWSKIECSVNVAAESHVCVYNKMKFQAGYFYVYGGTQEGKSEAVVYKMKLIQNKKLKIEKIVCQNNIPANRKGHTMHVVDPDQDNPKLLVVGGMDMVSGKVLNDIWEFDLVKSSWKVVGTIDARYNHCSEYDKLREKIIFFGGMNGKNEKTNSVYEIDLKKNYAIKKLTIHGSKIPPKRELAGSFLVNDVFVVFGGNTENGVLADCWGINLSTMCWHFLSKKLGPERFGHKMFYYNSLLFSFGGMTKLGKLSGDFLKIRINDLISKYVKKTVKTKTSSGMMPKTQIVSKRAKSMKVESDGGRLKVRGRERVTLRKKRDDGKREQLRKQLEEERKKEEELERQKKLERKKRMEEKAASRPMVRGRDTRRPRVSLSKKVEEVKVVKVVPDTRIKVRGRDRARVNIRDRKPAVVVAEKDRNSNIVVTDDVQKILPSNSGEGEVKAETKRVPRSFGRDRGQRDRGRVNIRDREKKSGTVVKTPEVATVQTATKEPVKKVVKKVVKKKGVRKKVVKKVVRVIKDKNGKIIRRVVGKKAVVKKKSSGIRGQSRLAKKKAAALKKKVAPKRGGASLLQAVDEEEKEDEFDGFEKVVVKSDLEEKPGEIVIRPYIASRSRENAFINLVRKTSLKEEAQSNKHLSKIQPAVYMDYLSRKQSSRNTIVKDVCISTRRGKEEEMDLSMMSTSSFEIKRVVNFDLENKFKAQEKRVREAAENIFQVFAERFNQKLLGQKSNDLSQKELPERYKQYLRREEQGWGFLDQVDDDLAVEIVHNQKPEDLSGSQNHSKQEYVPKKTKKKFKFRLEADHVNQKLKSRGGERISLVFNIRAKRLRGERKRPSTQVRKHLSALQTE